jgi:hypothetical protein
MTIEETRTRWKDEVREFNTSYGRVDTGKKEVLTGG